MTDNKPKLPVEHFYSQFHNTEHHNDPGEETRKKWYEHEIKHREALKPFDFHTMHKKP
jgi:hypothetical protein